MQRFLGHFETLLAAAVGSAPGEGPDTPLGLLPLLGEAERRRMLVEWNASDVDFWPGVDETPCIHHLFEAQAAVTPDAVAVIAPEVAGRSPETITYGELDRRANRLGARAPPAGGRPRLDRRHQYGEVGRDGRRPAGHPEGWSRVPAGRSELSRRAHPPHALRLGRAGAHHPVAPAAAAATRRGRAGELQNPPRHLPRRRLAGHSRRARHRARCRGTATQSRLRDLHLGLHRAVQGRDGRAQEHRERVLCLGRRVRPAPANQDAPADGELLLRRLHRRLRARAVLGRHAGARPARPAAAARRACTR